MNYLAAVVIVAGWGFSFCVLACIALLGATLAPNSEAIYWVMGITTFNAVCYVMALHHLLKYKHLCDKFIEE